MPCPFAAIGGPVDNEVAISWDKDAGECQYTITDASSKEVEGMFLWAEQKQIMVNFVLPCYAANTATEQVAIAIKAIGRYKVELVCAKGSEAMFFDTKFREHTFTWFTH